MRFKQFRPVDKPPHGQPVVAGWKTMPRAAYILSPGNAKTYETGDWRSFRPIWSEEKCIQCLRCWVFCPDDSILVRDAKVVGIDYTHCKGCGICANECPSKVHAIEMKSEAEV